jgi:hypothetical protein
MIDCFDWCSRDLRQRWRLQLGLQSELELKIIKDNELKLLPDWRAVAEFQPRCRYAVQTVVKS